MKKILLFAFILILGIVAWILFTPSNDSLPDDGPMEFLPLNEGQEPILDDLEIESDEDNAADTSEISELPESEPSIRFISMESGNFFFRPNFIDAMPGEALRIDIEQNTGIHTFVIDEIGLKQQVNAGSSFEFTAPTEPGDYVFYCDVGSHRELGMEGILRVADVLEAVTIRDPIADPVDTAE